MSKPCLVVDIGGGSLKIGLSSKQIPKILDNAMMKAKSIRNRVFFGDDIDDCNNLSGLYCLMPFKKGYVNNWDIQKQILDHVIENIMAKEKHSIGESNVVVTEPYFNFASTKETMNEIFFEEYQVQGLVRTNPGFLVHYKDNQEKKSPQSRYALVVDSGYSFSHFVPYQDGKIMKQYVKRMSIGGKILTNRLIEIISYRQLDVRSEVYVMNQCKEDVCYLSQDFRADMDVAKKTGPRNTIARDYVLPDYASIRRGYTRPPDQTTGRAAGAEQYILRLNNERFTVPELLFRPNEVGYDEMGLAEATCHVINSLPAALQPHFCRQVLLAGGNANFPGLHERLQEEITTSVPDDFPVTVSKSERPQTAAWEGGALLANSSADLKKYLVTKKEYEEYGHSLCEERFPI